MEGKFEDKLEENIDNFQGKIHDLHSHYK